MQSTPEEYVGDVRPRSRRTPRLVRIKRLLRRPEPYRMLLGLALFFAAWYILVDWLSLSRFSRLPSLTGSLGEWLSLDPQYGISFFTEKYYIHIWASIKRVIYAFIMASTLGIAVGILMGWRKIFYGLTFPILELLRPIPILAYIPIAIFLLPGRELPIIGLTFLAAFYITTLNTLLGVQSIHRDYFRAGWSLGFSQTALLRHVIIPGALPYVFVGLQIAMAACWFSLVAAEIVSGTAGLGYAVWEAYYYVQFPVMVIGMVTLGVLGYVSSALLRILGFRLMRWRRRALGETE